MQAEPASFLLDQNVPFEVTDWLRSRLPSCLVAHCSELGMATYLDDDVFSFAQRNGSIIVTYDEDFADQRQFPVGSHCGIIRLRVEPTTAEATYEALDRLLSQFPPEQLVGKLVIIQNERIRIIPS